MKKYALLILTLLLLLCMVGCSETNEQVSVPEQGTTESTEPTALSVDDLTAIFAAMDLKETRIARHDAKLWKEEQFDANDAIRTAYYLEILKGFTWKEAAAPADWNTDFYDYYTLYAPNATLTAYQQERLLHVTTPQGEGTFALPDLFDEESDTYTQTSYMCFGAFSDWYREAHIAALCGGKGTPLTPEELDWFVDYTASEQTVYIEKYDVYSNSASEISCFFTSEYSDPRDMDAEAFLWYCPSRKALNESDTEECRLVEEKLDWRGDDGHRFTIEELPTPCQRLPRSYVNEILTKYAGITVEEMHTNWFEEAFYIPETDCFYTFTSDYGPGYFLPRHGEKEGGVVTLWGEGATLVLKKHGDGYRILSHRAADIS